MSTDKVKLRKLIDFVAELASQDGNDWFIRELIYKLDSAQAQKITIETLNEIHEHCIKRISKSQAENFYSDFKIHDIKDRLIDLHIEMENQKRNNNYILAFLSIYQQLELIITHLYDIPKTIEYLERDRKKNALLKYNPSTKITDKVMTNGPTVASLTWYKTTPQPTFKSKFRAILFYYYYNEKIPAETFYDTKLTREDRKSEFNTIWETIELIHIARNLIHEGSIPDDATKEKSASLKRDAYKHYLRSIGFLEKFVTTINSRLSS
jgi:hypothetical protein